MKSKLFLLLASVVVSATLLLAYLWPALPWLSPINWSGESANDNTNAYSKRVGYFPIGVFEDASVFEGDAAKFEAMIVDLKSKGFDSVILTNGQLERDIPLLEVSDRLGFGVFIGPQWELWRFYWPEDVPGDEETARRVLTPMVDRLKSHPSVWGYYIIDEAPVWLKDKIAMAIRIFREIDPTRPAIPNMVGIDRIGPIFVTAQPDVLLLAVYPFGARNGIGDFRMTGFGYEFFDVLTYVRIAKISKPADTPLWAIMQTHQFKQPDEWFALREPSAAELRAEYWLTIGEGATGVFWFAYSTQQDWRGLVDNPLAYEEVTSLTQRTLPLRELLSSLGKVADEFTVAGGANPYVSTLSDGSKRYAVVVNRDCTQPAELRIGSRWRAGTLKDLESGQTYRLGEPIPFRPGDGRIFELSVDRISLKAAPAPNGVPSIDPDLSRDVEAWWANHPFNPVSPNYLSYAIKSPLPQVNVAEVHNEHPESQTAGIEEALALIPVEGGTLFFPKEHGPYVIVKEMTSSRNVYDSKSQIPILGRSHIHFVSDGATISSSETVFHFSSMEFRDSGTFDKPTRDFYFKDLIFDGNGSAIVAVSADGARDVMFDGVVFENYRTADPNNHGGIVSAINHADNIVFRNNTFMGGQAGVYLDGTVGSIFIGNGFYGGYVRGAILLFTNDDVERRKSDYVVIADNTFGPNRNSVAAIDISSANTLVTGNVAVGPWLALVRSQGKLKHYPDNPYTYYGNRIVGNRTGWVSRLLSVVGATSYEIGQFDVRDNRAIGLDYALEMNPANGVISNISVHNNQLSGSFLPQVRVFQMATNGDVKNIQFFNNDLRGQQRSLLLDQTSGQLDPAVVQFGDNRMDLQQVE